MDFFNPSVLEKLIKRGKEKREYAKHYSFASVSRAVRVPKYPALNSVGS